MKKLMIAAAAVAMVGGAFAEGDYAAVYNIKYNLKTIVPKKVTCGKSTCTICKKTDTGTGYYYENGTVTLEGVLAYCSSCVKVGTAYTDAILAVWDSKNKQPIYFATAWQDSQTVDDVIAKAAKWGE